MSAVPSFEDLAAQFRPLILSTARDHPDGEPGVVSDLGLLYMEALADGRDPRAAIRLRLREAARYARHDRTLPGHLGVPESTARTSGRWDDRGESWDALGEVGEPVGAHVIGQRDGRESYLLIRR